MARDVLLVGVWVYGWAGEDVIWRGNTLAIQSGDALRLRERGWPS